MAQIVSVTRLRETSKFGGQEPKNPSGIFWKPVDMEGEEEIILSLRGGNHLSGNLE
jgi:hypothetical protein